MSLLVSIHDVTPALEQPVRELWKLCIANDVTPALLVVPNWHGDWPLAAHSAFVSWVQTCANDGAEIFLHGERHDEIGLPRSIVDQARAFGRTKREGEFLTLTHQGAQQRIERGLALLRELHLDPIGFVPPAWLAREDTFDVVRRAGLAVSEDAVGVRLHAQNTRLVAPALRWSGRTAVRAIGSQFVARYRWTVQRTAPLVRLALHPQDLLNSRTRASVFREVGRWTAAVPAIRYADVVESSASRNRV